MPFAGIVFIIAVGVVLLTQQFRKNLYRQQLKQEELKSQYQLEILRSSILVQEEERKRIAQDIHDELGATLSIARMHLMQLEQKSDASEPFLPAILNVRNLTETALASMRRISHELMPPQLEQFGLVKTLEVVAEQLNKAGELHVDILTLSELPEISWPVKLTLYRMSMELINNTIKHAKASRVSVELFADKASIICKYTDNGVGLNPDNKAEGLGHKSIKGRVNSLGGTVFISNTEGGGFLCLAKLPLAG
ncbi:MAG: sensor histidine kinase [Flavobacteriia bacterium]|nr:sensor histidine kinase [Flavobacteriia bacterium]